MFNRKEYMNKYRELHKEEIKIQKKKYRLLHKNRLNKKAKQWILKHKDQLKQYRKKYEQNKLKMDINFKLKIYLRRRVLSALKGNPKLETTMKLVGCHIDLLKLYLQSKFQLGMSFSNYGKWHIDHIIPCARFDLRKVSEQKKCFHYTNLQPLWAEDNFKKSDIIKEK